MPKSKYEWLDLCKGVLLLATLLMSGAGLGYWYKGTERDQDHADEIARMQEGHLRALDVLSGRISQTADRVTAAADVAADAAQAAQEAAGTADKAATAANRAATTAGKAVTQSVSPAQPSKAENRAINQAVQQANTQIKGQK